MRARLKRDRCSGGTMSKNWLLAAVSVFTIHATAESKALFQVLDCPAIGDEYDQLLSKLESIKTSIKKDANCANVELKVKSLQDLVTTERQKVMDVISTAGDNPLTAEQSKIVRDYAEDVTKKVAALNDLFSQSNYCFKDDKADHQLGSLAGFVGEAANMVGSLSGPYGTPIAMAGNIIAGFLTGLDQIFKTRAGFDFNNPAQWKSYVNNLCTYHNYRDQIEHLLNPAARIKELQDLKNKLDFQIGIMSRDCGDCRVIMNSYEMNKALGENGLKDLLGVQIQSADVKNVKPYGSYMLQSLGLRDWAVAEIKRVQKDAQTYWAEASGRHLLTQAKNDLELFLIEKQGPRFLGQGVQQAHNDYNDFLNMAGTEGRQLYGMIDRTNRDLLGGRVANIGWSDPLSVFRALVITPIGWERVSAGQQRDDVQYAWLHYRDQSVDKFRTAMASTQMVQTFCSFFAHGGFYSPEIRGACRSPYFSKQVAEQNGLAAELNAANIPLGPLSNSTAADEQSVADKIEAISRAIENRGVGR
jgi:hypothetical protein